MTEQASEVPVGADLISLRSRAEVTAMPDDATLLGPGIVHLSLWRPVGPGDPLCRPDGLGDVDDRSARLGEAARHDTRPG
ncbi:hypothetical protein O7632_24010 [Solwaraspora sp. WMMD406]|uniref:hypothetical protein n=1 Tax=Solwaraspora sp. WMMD406 TaxID=3016095 RepID=UPI0024169FD2|nr:hypothetical protein [Solwaraspora sp. WMMD406]MDG4767139.1 hypothetical protein [Solwaraspora sp. WMMD406]